jgi:hypothetical protein
MSRLYVIQSGSSRRNARPRPSSRLKVRARAAPRQQAFCEDGSVETRLPVDAGRSSLRLGSTIRLTLEFRQPSDLRRLGANRSARGIPAVAATVELALVKTGSRLRIRQLQRGPDRVRGRASSNGAGSHPERIPLARFFGTITSGKSKSVLRCFVMTAPIKRLRTARATNAAGWPTTRFSRRLNVLNCPTMAKKKKGSGGQRNPLKRLKMDKGIKGNQSLFLG